MRTKIARSTLATILILCMIVLVCGIAAAAEKEKEPQRYTGVSTCYTSLSISAWGRASCGSYVYCNSGYSADVTMKLMRDSTEIKSWNTSGSGIVTMDKTYYVVGGHSYTVAVTISVKDSNGNVVDTINTSSNTVTF